MIVLRTGARPTRRPGTPAIRGTARRRPPAPWRATGSGRSRRRPIPPPDPKHHRRRRLAPAPDRRHDHTRGMLLTRSPTTVTRSGRTPHTTASPHFSRTACVVRPIRASMNSCGAQFVNGLITSTPAMTWPELRSSVQRRRQPRATALRTIMASQNDNRCSSPNVAAEMTSAAVGLCTVH